VLQDKKYKNRELDILKEVKHPNILEMKDYFFTTEGS
jgi:serine/threonine protein kinase